MVGWGIRKTDELGFDAIVESGFLGPGLYEKHGFAWQKDVQVVILGYENDSERLTGSFA